MSTFASRTTTEATELGPSGKEHCDGNISTLTDSQSTSQQPTTSTSSSSSPSWASIVKSVNYVRASRPRPIIVKFASYRVRQSVQLRARRRLKESGITIAEDITKSNYDILRTARLSKTVTSSAWSQDGRTYVSLPASNGKTTKKLITSLEEAEKKPMMN